MIPALRAALIYTMLLAALWPAFRVEPAEEGALPLLPVEVELVAPQGRGICGSGQFERSLAARAFRWTRRQERPAVWRRYLTLVCEDSEDRISVSLLDGKTGVFKTTYARPAGSQGGDTAARVAARLLPLEPQVARAALKAYFENQSDVARAGADLWRANRWAQAADVLGAALENGWDEAAQAELYFGLADAYAHLGRPRQAYWYALAYLGISRKAPPEAWLKSLRGAASLAGAAPAAVEPQAEALARAWRQAAAQKRWDKALDALNELCRAAPWAVDYQEAVASAYASMGWEPLADSWRRRAALTRRLAADEALQARLAALLR